MIKKIRWSRMFLNPVLAAAVIHPLSGIRSHQNKSPSPSLQSNFLPCDGMWVWPYSSSNPPGQNPSHLQRNCPFDRKVENIFLCDAAHVRGDTCGR